MNKPVLTYCQEGSFLQVVRFLPNGWLTPFTNAVHWLWGKISGWKQLAWIFGICISLSFVAAREQMYGTTRALVTAVGVLLLAKVLNDSVVEHKPIKEILVAFLINGAIITAAIFGLWRVIAQIEWNHEVVIKMTFKSSPLFTEKRQKEIIWSLNEYYRYLTKIGFDLPVEIPPLGLSPPHGIMGGGGSEGPAYFSSLIISEDNVDDPNVLRSVYSSYTFNRILVWPDAYKNGISRTEAEDDGRAAWIFACYFPRSFSGNNTCADETPGRMWREAIWEVRREYGQDYTDGLMCYTVKTWKGVPVKYIENFDQFFRYRLAGGESVKDNGQRSSEINAIFKRHGLQITPPW